VDRVVAGEQPDTVETVPVYQVVVLLVGQRLDGRRVEALAALREGKMDGELTDHGLAGPGRGADEHAAAILERLAGFTLEGVEVERQLFRESRQRRISSGAFGPPAGRSVPLGGAAHRNEANDCRPLACRGTFLTPNEVKGPLPNGRFLKTSSARLPSARLLNAGRAGGAHPAQT